MSRVWIRVNARCKKENVKISKKTQKITSKEGRKGYTVAIAIKNS